MWGSGIGAWFKLLGLCHADAPLASCSPLMMMVHGVILAAEGPPALWCLDVVAFMGAAPGLEECGAATMIHHHTQSMGVPNRLSWVLVLATIMRFGWPRGLLVPHGLLRADVRLGMFCGGERAGLLFGSMRWCAARACVCFWVLLGLSVLNCSLSWVRTQVCGLLGPRATLSIIRPH
jgi:hypothetical protein